MDELQAARLARWFKRLNRWLMIPMWRLGLGRLMNSWPSVGGRILVLNHTGRKSGLRRQTPLNYAPSPPTTVHIIAGLGGKTDWYRNIINDPAVEVWLPDARWKAEAVDVSDHPHRVAIMRDVLFASGFAAPLAGVDPRRLSDHEIEEKTAEYKVVELRQLAEATGSGGPGDLAWVWVVVAALWLAKMVRRK